MLDPNRAAPKISVGHEYPALSRYLGAERVFPFPRRTSLPQDGQANNLKFDQRSLSKQPIRSQCGGQ
jgi:hypothetical protein